MPTSCSRIGQLLTGSTSSTTVSVKHKVKEWTWKIARDYSICAIRGADPSSALEIVAPSKVCAVFVTRTETSPHPQVKNFAPIDVDVTPLLKLFGKDKEGLFAINRMDPKCLTPRRNMEVESVLSQCNALSHWAASIVDHFCAMKDSESIQVSFGDSAILFQFADLPRHVVLAFQHQCCKLAFIGLTIVSITPRPHSFTSTTQCIRLLS